MTAPAMPNFDRIARPYRWMEYLTFGRALERCRNHYLPRLWQCHSALVLGDGDGRFLAGLLAANRELRADAIDTSAAMLRLLQLSVESVGGGSRLRTHQASALNSLPEQRFDLVATHFFLDCLTQEELNTLCRQVVPHLEPGALWVVSDFHIPRGAMRWPAHVLVRALYFAFRLLTNLRTTALPEHAAILTAAGFGLVDRRHWLGGLLSSELWEYTPAMQLPPQRPKTPYPLDPVPDPEPASPSLPEPDPCVFHHEPATPKTGQRTSSDS
jgi:hypothetical protein